MKMNKEVKLAIAPIAWTNDDMPELGAENTFEQCISEMALAGYEGSEVGNKYPDDPLELKSALDLRGLTICNTWFSAYLTTEPLEKTVERFIKKCDFLSKVGAKVIGVAEQGHSIQGMMELPVLSNKPVFTEQEWMGLTEGLNELGSLARERGMTLTYHHHMGTGIQNLKEIDRLMNVTDPELVSLLFDSGHAYFAGIDPEILLKKYIKRIKHVHLKDIREEILKQVKEKGMSFLQAVKAGVFTVPGDGVINFDFIFKLLAESNYRGWMVVEAEQDPAVANPFKYAKMAREYINNITGL